VTISASLDLNALLGRMAASHRRPGERAAGIYAKQASPRSAVDKAQPALPARTACARLLLVSRMKRRSHRLCHRRRRRSGVRWRRLPEDSHPPIVYLSGGDGRRHAGSAQLLDFLAGRRLGVFASAASSCWRSTSPKGEHCVLRACAGRRGCAF